MTKRCSKCKRDLPITRFTRRSYCHTCRYKLDKAEKILRNLIFRQRLGKYMDQLKIRDISGPPRERVRKVLENGPARRDMLKRLAFKDTAIGDVDELLGLLTVDGMIREDDKGNFQLVSEERLRA